MSAYSTMPTTKRSPQGIPRQPVQALSPPYTDIEDHGLHPTLSRDTSMDDMSYIKLDRPQSVTYMPFSHDSPASRSRRGTMLPYHGFGVRGEPRNAPNVPAKKHLIVVIPSQKLANDQGIHGHTPNPNSPERHSQGILMPLLPSMYGQLTAVAREFGFPSTTGLCVYLEISMGGQSLSPRVSDDSWPILWAHLLDEQGSTSQSNSFPVAGRIEIDVDIRKARWFESWIAGSRRETELEVNPLVSVPASIVHRRMESRTTVAQDGSPGQLEASSSTPEQSTITRKHVPRKLSLVDKFDTVSISSVSRILGRPEKSYLFNDDEHAHAMHTLSPVVQEDEPQTAKWNLEMKVKNWRASSTHVATPLAPAGQTILDSNLDPVNMPNSAPLPDIDVTHVEEELPLNLNDFQWSISSAGPPSPGLYSSTLSDRVLSVHLAHRAAGSVCMTPSICTSFGPLDDDYVYSPVPQYWQSYSPDLGMRALESVPLTPATATSWGPPSEMPESPMSNCRAPSVDIGMRALGSAPLTAMTATTWGPPSEWPESPITHSRAPSVDMGHRAMHLDLDDDVPPLSDHVRPWNHVWPYQRSVQSHVPTPIRIPGSSNWKFVWPYRGTSGTVVPAETRLGMSYPSFNIYPAVYPNFDIYPHVHSDEVYSPNILRIETSLVRGVPTGYPSFNIYPAVYPNFNIYPAVLEAMIPLHSMSSADVVDCLLPVYYPSFNLYPAIYPYFDLYGMNEDDSSSAIAPESYSIVDYPSFNLYPAVYPHFDLYPSLSGALLEESQSAPLNLDYSFACYPSLILYPVVYPYFDLYPTISGALPQDLHFTAASSNLTQLTSTRYPSFNLYPAVYPYFDLYPTLPESVTFAVASLNTLLVQDYPSFNLYPAIYPHFDIYPAISSAFCVFPRLSDQVFPPSEENSQQLVNISNQTVLGSAQHYYTAKVSTEVQLSPDVVELLDAQVEVGIELAINYPDFLLYPVVYPAFEIYPGNAHLPSESSRDVLPIALSAHYPGFNIYPAVYPQLEIYPPSALDPSERIEETVEATVAPMSISSRPTKINIVQARNRLPASIHSPDIDSIAHCLSLIALAAEEVRGLENVKPDIVVALRPYYPNIDIYPPGYPMLEIYPTLPTPTVERYQSQEIMCKPSYPAFDIYPAVYPHFDIYRSGAASTLEYWLEELSVSIPAAYPAFNIYPALYPYFDLYSSGSAITPEYWREELPVAVSTAYPGVDVYPVVYPSFDIYGSGTASDPISWREELSNSVLISYPAFDIYPTVYPYFDLYATGSSSTPEYWRDELSTAVADRHLAINLYRACYPYFDIYGTGHATTPEYWREELPVSLNACYPATNVYPAVYPSFDLYASGTASVLEEWRSELPVTLSWDYPAISLYPALYPNFDIYSTGFTPNSVSRLIRRTHRELHEAVWGANQIKVTSRPHKGVHRVRVRRSHRDLHDIVMNELAVAKLRRRPHLHHRRGASDSSAWIDSVHSRHRPAFSHPELPLRQAVALSSSEPSRPESTHIIDAHEIVALGRKLSIDRKPTPRPTHMKSRSTNDLPVSPNDDPEQWYHPASLPIEPLEIRKQTSVRAVSLNSLHLNSERRAARPPALPLEQPDQVHQDHLSAKTEDTHHSRSSSVSSHLQPFTIESRVTEVERVHLRRPSAPPQVQEMPLAGHLRGLSDPTSPQTQKTTGRRPLPETPSQQGKVSLERSLSHSSRTQTLDPKTASVSESPNLHRKPSTERGLSRSLDVTPDSARSQSTKHVHFPPHAGSNKIHKLIEDFESHASSPLGAPPSTPPRESPSKDQKSLQPLLTLKALRADRRLTLPRAPNEHLLQNRKNLPATTRSTKDAEGLKRARSVLIKTSSPTSDSFVPKVPVRGALLDRSKSVGTAAYNERLMRKRGDSIAGPVHVPDH